MLQLLRDRKQFLIIKGGVYSTLALLLEGETTPGLTKRDALSTEPWGAKT